MKAFSTTSIPALLAGICAMVLATFNAPAASLWDSGFNPGGYFSSSASFKAIAVQSDGKVLFGGNFVYYGKYPNGYPFTVNNLVRFNSNGTVDTSFAPNPNYTVRAMALQSDGKILIGGVFTTAGGYNQTYICRLHPGGSADYNTFQAPTPNGYINAIALTSSEMVLIGGHFTTLNGFSYTHVACLNTNGSIVTSFNPGITGSTNPAVNAIAIHPAGSYNGGNIIIGGDFTTVGGISRINCARLYSSGGVDSTFNAVDPNATPQYLDAPVYAVATDYGSLCNGGSQTCEKVLVGGAFTSFNGKYLARLDSNGTKDSTYLPVDGVVKCIRMASNHQFYIAGAFYVLNNGATRDGVARFNQSSGTYSVDGWATGSSVTGGTSGSNVETVGPSSGSTIYIGGTFTSVDGNARTNIARLNE